MKELLIVLLLLGRAVYSDNQIAEENDAISSVQQAQELIRELTPKRKPQYNGIEFSGVYTTNGTCGYIDRERRFMYLIRRECPISYETLAVDGFLYDPMGFIRYRCHNYRPAEFIENKVYMLSASQLLKIINNPPKDQYRRNWCMITFFYSPKCVFSEELAPAVNAIPFNFPRIVSVAVDATHFSRLNTRYGIAGTPTLLLWINGVPISRMDDRELNNTGLMGFLDEWTDVESLRVTDNEELPLVIRHEPNQTHWETPMAILTLLLVGTYYCRSWFFHRAPMSSLLQRFGTNPDDVCAYFNAM